MNMRVLSILVAAMAASGAVAATTAPVTTPPAAASAAAQPPPPPRAGALPPLPPGCVVGAPLPPPPPRPAANTALQSVLGLSADQAGRVRQVFEQQATQAQRMDQQRRVADARTCQQLRAIVGAQVMARWAKSAPPAPSHGRPMPPCGRPGGPPRGMRAPASGTFVQPPTDR